MGTWRLTIRTSENGQPLSEPRQVDVSGQTLADAIEEAPLGFKPEDMAEHVTDVRWRADMLSEADGA